MLAWLFLFAQGLPAQETVTVFQWVSTGGAVAALLVFLYGFKAEWWVTGEVHRRRLDEIKELQEQIERCRTDCVDSLAERDRQMSEVRQRLEEQIIPLVIRSTDLLSRFVARGGDEGG